MDGGAADDEASMWMWESGATQEPSVVFVRRATGDEICGAGVLTGELGTGSWRTVALTPGLVLGRSRVEAERRASADPVAWPTTGASGEGPPQPMIITVATTAPRGMLYAMMRSLIRDGRGPPEITHLHLPP